MAISGSFNTSSVGSFYFTFSWSRTGYSSTANEHYIYYELIAHNTPGNYRTVYLKNLYVDGKQVFYNAGTSGSGKKYYNGDVVASGNVTVKSSNSSGDGSLSASFEAGVGSYPGSNCSGSGSWSLDRIPRKFTSTPDISENSKTINTYTFNWSTSETCSKVILYINNDTFTWTGSKKSGTITATDLSPATTYDAYIKCYREDSGLDSNSSTKQFTTYNKGTISSAPNFNDEENPTITYSNPAGSVVSSLDVCISLTGSTDDIPYRATSKTGTSYTFNLTDAERKVLRKASANSASITVKFFIRTGCNGITYYDNVSKTMTIKDGKPVFSNFTVEEADDGVYNLTQNRQKFIRKYSDIKVTIPSGNKMVAQKEATAKNYNVIVGDQNKLLTYSTDDLTTTISNMDSNKVEVYAIDSRDNQTPVSKSLDIIDYKELVLSNIKFDRKNSVEETILIIGNGTWTNVNFGAVINSIKSFVFRRKSKNDVAWSDWYSIKELFNINENGTFSNKVENEFTAVTFDFGEEYDVEVKIEDELSTVIRPVSVNSGKILMSALKEYGVCFGGVYDKNLGGALQVKGKNLEELAAGINGNSLIDKGELDSTININLLSDAGIYICNNPTTANGYPTTSTGVLEVIKSSETSGHVIQRYSVDGSNVTYERHIGEELGSWEKLLVGQTLLWDDWLYMNASQTVNVPISEQKNGVMLMFCAYSNGEPHNWNWANFVILKKEAEILNGGGRTFPMGGTIGIDATKYIYIYPNKIEGNDANQQGNSANYVLRKIIGF